MTISLSLSSAFSLDTRVPITTSVVTEGHPPAESGAQSGHRAVARRRGLHPGFNRTQNVWSPERAGRCTLGSARDSADDRSRGRIACNHDQEAPGMNLRFTSRGPRSLLESEPRT